MQTGIGGGPLVQIFNTALITVIVSVLKSYAILFGSALSTLQVKIINSSFSGHFGDQLSRFRLSNFVQVSMVKPHSFYQLE